MQRNLLVSWCLMVAVAPAVAAGESLAEWAAGPMGVLLTAEEKTQVASIQGADAEQSFLELFWARRDPDLGTKENELRFAVEQRVIAADAEFGEGDTRGAMTPRGRVLILLGVPDRHGHMEIAEYMSGLYQMRPPPVISSEPNAQATMRGVSFNRAKGMAALWAYKRESLPAGIELDEGVEEVTFAFFDIDGEGVYILQRNIRRADTADAVLAAAPAALVLHPELDTLPTYALFAGAVAASAEQLTAFDTDPVPWPQGAAAMAAQGVASAGSLPAWIYLELPATAPAADTLVGRLRRGDGTVAGTFATEVVAKKGSHGTSYEAAVPVPSGQSVIDVALFTGVQVVAVRSLDLEVAEPSDVFISPVFAGAQVDQAKSSAAGDPFVFGGYHLVPRPDGDYAAGENLAVFCLVAVPDATDEVPVEAKVRMRWYVNGKAAPSAPPKPVALASAAPGVFVWGTQLPLATMTQGVSYTLKLKVTEVASGVSRTTEIPVSLY